MDAASRRVGGYLVLGGLMTVLDTTVTIVATPELISDFHAQLTTIQWVTTAYALALIAVMPLAAWFSGRFGARRVYLGAIAVFTVGSLLAGCAWDVGSLIAFRVVQGAGGGLLGPLAMVIALSAVAIERRGAMMSILGLPVLIGPLAGPLLAGILIDEASWRWVFWINAPLGLVAILMGQRVLPTPRSSARVRLDLLGLVLLSPALTLIVLGFSLAGGHRPITAAAVWAPVLAGAAMLAAFVRHSWSAPNPLIRTRVLHAPGMAAGLPSLMLFSAAYFGSAVIGPAYVQIVRGDSATLTGLVSIPQAVATGIALQIASRLVDRVQPRTVIGVGILLAVAGTAARVSVLSPHTSYTVIMSLTAVAGLGVGATLSPLMTAATRNLTGNNLAAGSTLLNLASQTALATGTALFATLLSWLVRIYAPDLGPGGLGAATGLSRAARGAHAAALTYATQITLAGAAVLMLLAALISRRLPKEHHPPSHTDTGPHHVEVTPVPERPPR
jgi:EmrB/QacA subfamily drug resistance transporter